MPTVQFTSALKRFFPDLEAGPVSGQTVAEVLQHLERQHPGLTNYLREDDGRLRKHVNIYIGDDLITDTQSLSDQVKDGDEVYIFQALSGG